jgi:hypothetical protein
MPLVDFRQARGRSGWPGCWSSWAGRRARAGASRCAGRARCTARRRPAARSFSAHLGRGVWRCFRCGAAGNALELWALATGQRLYPAVLRLYDRLGRPVPWLAAPPAAGARGTTDAIDRPRA